MIRLSEATNWRAALFQKKWGRNSTNSLEWTNEAAAGCSVHEIAAWSGHKTLAEIAHYTRSVEQEALAEAAMVKERTKLSKPEGHFDKSRKKASGNNGRN
jgi:hypothetical protein